MKEFHKTCESLINYNIKCAKVNVHDSLEYVHYHNIKSFPDLRFYIEKGNIHYSGEFKSESFLKWFDERRSR